MKKIPWQNRDRLGYLKAWIMTAIEAVMSPLEYYEKLKIEESYLTVLILCLLNSLCLTGPLVPSIFTSISFLAAVFIVLLTTILLFGIAFIVVKVLHFWGEKISYTQSIYVLVYATPAFVFAMIPAAGYWLAGIVFGVLVTVGFHQVCRMSFKKIVPVGILVPFLILVPYHTVNFVKYWEENHPKIDESLEAQKILSVIAIAAENYAAKNEGSYPKNSAALVAPAQQYLVRDYCGTKQYHYRFDCDFRGFGYFLKAEPLEWKGWGKKTFYVATGGKFWAE